jgi:bifunctional DNA-binding transcriptional regulator/antitoxin component of YhaV-PrlF toxin-antitoxin module
MRNKMKQLIKRNVNSKGQICVPASLRNENIDFYMVEEHNIDENGNTILKMYPVEDETDEDEK